MTTAKPCWGVVNVDVTPGGSEIRESVAPNIRNRSSTIAVEVNIETEEAEGVLFAHGSRFGGHALYIKDRKLKYASAPSGASSQW